MRADPEAVPPRRGRTGNAALSERGIMLPLPPGGAADPTGETAIQRDRAGRFAAGTPSPNATGRPRKPDYGPYHDLMARDVTANVEGRQVRETLLEQIDRIVQHAAINGDGRARKLWDKRLKRARREDKQRAAIEKQERRKQRELALGLKAQLTHAEHTKDLARTRAMGDALTAMMGNFDHLRERLKAMGVYELVDKRVVLASWVKPPDAS